ncbi:hypothetical protein CTZ27_07795 [Streptomyces griseocarneus]|nr:hypothetical protein CTZ27_07795 [Streptomyces griseocarneus]
MKTKPLPDLPDLMPKVPNGIGWAALVLALLALTAATSIVGFPLVVLFSLAATVCGMAGRRRVKRGETQDGVPALVGLVVGAITATVCLGIVVWAFNALSHIDDRPGDLVSRGGSDNNRLGPGGTARYRDGLKVTVGKPRHVTPAKEGMTYEYAVTYVNDQKESIELGYGMRCDERVMRVTSDGSVPVDPTEHRTHSGFPGELTPHQKVTVKLTVDASPGPAALELACSPSYSRDDAHWLLPLTDD